MKQSVTIAEKQWSGAINPGNPVTCENCGAEYLPQGYECGPVQPCPKCGK